jgi:hypothetical protein
VRRLSTRRRFSTSREIKNRKVRRKNAKDATEGRNDIIISVGTPSFQSGEEEMQFSRMPVNAKSPTLGLGFLTWNSGSSTWARTRDLRINSPALYRLSYRGTEMRIIGVECSAVKRFVTFQQ